MTPADLEAFALLADKYASVLRGWKAVLEKAAKAGVETEMNGIVMLKGNFDRELDALIKLQGQISVIESKTERAELKRGADLHASKPPRKGRGS
jgi:hypothetical protein